MNLFTSLLVHILLTMLTIAPTTVETSRTVNPPVLYTTQQATVTQGDRVNSIHTGRQNCTVGYVDVENRQFHIAEHCVSDSGRFYNEQAHLIGETVARARDQKSRFTHDKDVAIVAIPDGVVIGGNPYSGDVAVDNDDITKHDELCMYGSTTGIIKCGEINGIKGNMVISSGKIAPQPGDSGGPAWIPGKGYVGVASTYVAKRVPLSNVEISTRGTWVSSHEFANDNGGNIPVYQG